MHWEVVKSIGQRFFNLPKPILVSQESKYISNMFLVLNNGSTSLKFELFQVHTENVLATGILRESDGMMSLDLSYKKTNEFEALKTKEFIIQSKFDRLDCVWAELKNLFNLEQLKFVAHRVVHGGDFFTKPTIVGQRESILLEELNDLAPLHNPHSLQIIKQLQKTRPDLCQIAVFDTSFHSNLPAYVSKYALSADISSKLSLKRYGFHGISHKSLSECYSQLKSNVKHKKSFVPQKIISCHLGGGASVCAIKDGVSQEISMGFSPEEGLIMATRVGNIGAGAVLHLQQKLGWTPAQTLDFLNQQSGLRGLSGYTQNMQELVKDMSKNHSAKLAVDAYIHSVQKYIGAYATILEGFEALIFTGGVGEGSPQIRRLTCKKLEFLGLRLDIDLNADVVEPLEPVKISQSSSTVEVWVIPAKEEKQIAKESLELYSKWINLHKSAPLDG
jgi:acetate kinase